MSALANALSEVDPDDIPRTRKGPEGACAGRYPADVEDWEQVEALRCKVTWKGAQVVVDDKLGLTTHVPNDVFRYHWRRKCSCWPVRERQS